MMHHVESRLRLRPELKEQRSHRVQAFGWDIVQQVQGSVMEFVFTKKFTNFNVFDVMHKTWTNDINLSRFKTVKAETSRLEVLQQINPNAVVFVRDVNSFGDISVFRSVFVHFLVEASREFPISDADGNQQTLTGTGFVLGTQSIATDHSRHATERDAAGRKIAWANLALTTEAYDVVDPATGEHYQQVVWAGRTDYCTEEDAHRNAADTLQGLLREQGLFATNDDVVQEKKLSTPSSPDNRTSQAPFSILPPTKNYNAIAFAMCRRKLSPDKQEARRVKNREGMRKARERHRQELLLMKTTLAQLEKQHAELTRRAAATGKNATLTACNHLPTEEDDGLNPVEMARRLGAEKLHLQAILKQKIAWTMQIQRVLDFEASSLAAEQHFQPQQPITDIDSMGETLARQELDFHPITEWDLTRFILDNKCMMHHVESRLRLRPELKEQRSHRVQAFGWDIVQQVQGSVMERGRTTST
ncbi:hypothetical protein ON010_g15679 [Phytophthora cinnamomi]|nr:hypothetical protein ON010_g15679 [Phytophthora cinnamomi]